MYRRGSEPLQEASPGLGKQGSSWGGGLPEMGLGPQGRSRCAGASLSALRGGTLGGPEESLRTRLPLMQMPLREQEETGSPSAGRTTEWVQQLLQE